MGARKKARWHVVAQNAPNVLRSELQDLAITLQIHLRHSHKTLNHWGPLHFITRSQEKAIKAQAAIRLIYGTESKIKECHWKKSKKGKSKGKWSRV